MPIPVDPLFSSTEIAMLALGGACVAGCALWALWSFAGTKREPEW